jgi:hypothetical protein
MYLMLNEPQFLACKELKMIPNGIQIKMIMHYWQTNKLHIFITINYINLSPTADSRVQTANRYAVLNNLRESMIHLPKLCHLLQK